jgi:RNA polymerase sigma factor for flagellar operon FliA
MKNQARHDAMVLEHQGLVRAIAWKIHRRLAGKAELDDLIAYGQLGLLEAIAAFDSTRNHKFTTYAWHRIRGAILDGLGRMTWFARADFERGDYELGGSEAPPAAENRRPARNEFDATALPDRESGAAERAMRLELIAFLADLVATLPEKEAALLRATFYEGRTLTEAARRVGISTPWASRLQTRTLADMRVALERKGFR